MADCVRKSGFQASEFSRIDVRLRVSTSFQTLGSSVRFLYGTEKAGTGNCDDTLGAHDFLIICAIPKPAKRLDPLRNGDHLDLESDQLSGQGLEFGRRDRAAALEN